MGKMTNREAICEALCERARVDRDVAVLCSDSRGSASLAPFAKEFPDRFIEVGIAEQDLVGIAAGLAKMGKKPWAASPASFLSTRSYEQAKVDCAYSNMNVKLLGISGGVSYGALGMTHHSLQDVACMRAIPNMRVYIPSDRFQAKRLAEELLGDGKPAYIRVGRGASEDVYGEGEIPFAMDRATRVCGGDDVLIVACGDMVKRAKDASAILRGKGIGAEVLDMYCLKPLDARGLLESAKGKRLVVTAEEHSVYGGLGSAVCQVLAESDPKKSVVLALPDESAPAGTQEEVFRMCGLDAEGIAKAVLKGL